jgi:anaerobic dimethyl sulfoxide reductase subunit A
MNSQAKKIRVGCPAHNCGGRCLLIAHIEDGKIVRLDTDDRPDTIAAPQLRACARGRAYLRRQYHPDRLLYPLKRVGKRGEGKFVRISWDEALGEVSSQMVRVKSEYGNDALFVPYGTGSYNQLNGSHVARRLMNLFGGCLGIYNSYSWGATNIATPTVYGTLVTGNQRQDWLNSRYIIMWGWNPAEMRDGTNSDYFIKLARENGARVVCIDPRHSLSAAALADEWIPIRPGTDAAMMSAMAYVMLTENLHDADFVRTHCVGFDASQMPVDGAESYSDYLFGARDGIPKTPEWAEAITAVPAATIARIAREYATSKPAALVQGYGMQRRAYGEQVVRAGCVLAAISGNVGISGGWASGLGLQAEDGGPHWTVFPLGENPVRASIPVFLWTEACLRAQALTSAEGVLGVPRLQNNIKLIYAVATNCLINQHANVNRSAEILRDESKVEFIVVQDNFLTPTGMFADIILPACTQFETWGVEDGWKYGDEVILQPKLVEPPGESKSDYQICADLAERLGIGEAFTEGRDEKDWVDYCLQVFRSTRFPELPTLDEFIEKNLGAYSNPVTNPKIAFADFRADPQKYPLNTPSGKIEIFSKQLHYMGNPNEIPAVPKYIQEWENPFEEQDTDKTDFTETHGFSLGQNAINHGVTETPRKSKEKLRASVSQWLAGFQNLNTEKADFTESHGFSLNQKEIRVNPCLSSKSVSKKVFPLQAIGHHTLARVHSTHANNDWLQEAFPQRIFINPIDAAARDIHDGDLVRVWNERGELVIPARVTPRILPGVVDIPQGAWWKPDANGVDHGGCINVLTSHRWTPLAFGSTQHTIMVEVERYGFNVEGEKPKRSTFNAQRGSS